jgi:hypothetical protein
VARLTVRLGRSHPVVFIVAVAFVALGAATFWSPESWIMTPAHVHFFGVMPRWVWGIVHVVLGASMLTARWWDEAARLSAVVCLTWAGVAAYPAVDGDVWNVVSVIAWTTIGAILLAAVRLPLGPILPARTG